MASILFVFPPTADPTGPYLSIPYLAAACQARGHATAAIDLNIEGYLDLLSGERLRRFASDCRVRLRRMPTDGLPFPLSTEYLALSLSVHDADRVADRIESALACLRDPDRFYDPRQYEESYRLLQRALALVSARYHPLELSFTGYRSPFLLNDAEEIDRDTRPEQNPFHPVLGERLLPEMERVKPDVVGISACFNAQLLQAFAAGRLLKERFPAVQVVMGGAAITQLVLRCDPEAVAELRPFADLLVLFEGEEVLCEILARIDAGVDPSAGLANVVRLGDASVEFVASPTAIDIDRQPPPDYGILPLDRYLSPELLLYVAPTRGCYWRKCAFCHYGLSDAGPAHYRRRSPERFVSDLELLRERHGARSFYFSGDLVDPAHLFAISERIIARELDVRFTSDLRAERSFSREKCDLLRRAGMVSAAFGTESDSQRLLDLMEKGTDSAAIRTVFDNFASAGIAVQAMTFLDFPTETAAEAHSTLDLLEQNRDRIDLFFVEQFDLEVGSRVFRHPERYGVAEVYFPGNDRYRFHACYTPTREAKRPAECQRLVQRLDRLAALYGRRPYPFAGAVSVAHTMLFFDRHGRGVFKNRYAGNGAAAAAHSHGGWLDATPRLADDLALCDWPYDLETLALHTGEVSEEIDQRRRCEQRDVGRATYEALAAAVPPVEPRESYYILPATGAPVAIPGWLWMLVSCLDGETPVRDAANIVRVPARQATEAVEALLTRGYLVAGTSEPAPD